MAEEKRVSVFIPRGASNEDPNLFVSVNGVNYILPRGKESSVPQHVACEIDRAKKAKEACDRRIDEMLNSNK